MIEILSAVAVLVAVSFIGYANGMEDAGSGNQEFHPGYPWDDWHKWGRAFLYVGCAGWFVPTFYPWGGVEYISFTNCCFPKLEFYEGSGLQICGV